MKRLFLTALTIFLVSVFWSSSLLAQEFGGPKLVLKEQEFNLKEVMEGKVVEHVFQVFNQGNKPLKIINVKPG
jgi:hypothetical protein